MKTGSFLFLTVMLLIHLCSCSTKYTSVEVNSFTKAAESISTNTLNVYELASEEEINSLISNSIKKEAVSPEDFKKKVVIGRSFEIRKKLVKVLNEYSKALNSLLCEEGTEGTESIDRFNESLKSISERHGSFINEKKIGRIKSLLSDILLARTFHKKKRAAVKAMKVVHPLLKKISDKMGCELKILKMLTNNFLSIAFKIRVAEMWPDNRADRVKYAELGAGIVKRRNELGTVFDCAIKAMESIPSTHLKVINRLEDGKVSAEEINQLLDKAIEFEESYLKVIKGEG